MATIKFYLDKRAQKKDGTYPLKISVRHNNESALIGLDVCLLDEQWDAQLSSIVRHPNKVFLNNYINTRRHDIETVLLELKMAARLDGMKMAAIKKSIEKALKGSGAEDEAKPYTFVDHFMKFVDRKTNTRTKEIYMATLDRIKDYDEDWKELAFEDITKDWLMDFNAHLSITSPSPNARAIHLRNIRAVFNDALDDEVTTVYPFRKFKIETVETAKRSLSVEEVRKLLTWPVEAHEERYRDLFMLIIYLRGINIGDLANLKSIDNGRITFNRMKTKRLYSMKVEPEAMEIIERYKGVDWLLFIRDDYAKHKDFAKRMNDNLQLIGEVGYKVKKVKGEKRKYKVKKGIFPDITTYWARHTWATLAAKLDIPKETIAASLGHGGKTVTDVYIDFDQSKVDEANRKVMDYVLGIERKTDKTKDA